MKIPAWLLGWAAAVGLALAGAAPARADDAKTAPAVGKKPGANPYVVIVGVGEFKDPTIKPRATAEADARALYDLLADPKYLGVSGDRAKLLLSKADPMRKAVVASHDAVVKAVEAAVEATGREDLIVLAFFGNGASAGDKTCFFTPETEFKERAKTGLLGADLEPVLKKLKGQRVLLLMDVHFKNYDPGKEAIAEPTLKDVFGAVFGGEDKDDAALPQDRVIVLGNVPSADPLTKGAHSLFADVLLAGLKGDKTADVEGYEPDGLVTVDELAKYLEKEIPNQAREVGKTNKEKELQPYIVGEQTAHFPVTRNPAVTDKVEARLKKLAALAADKTLSGDRAAEGEKYLSRMPKLKAQQELRKAYEKLVDGGQTPDQFEQARRAILDGLKISDTEVATFAKRVQDAISLVRGKYIKELDGADMTVAAIRGMYRRIEEAVPADLDAELKAAVADKKAKAGRVEQQELLVKARERLGKREDLDGTKDADLAVLMMLASLNDPYTTYLDQDAVRKMESQFRGQFSGIGIQIRRDLVRDGLLVVSPIKGSPAYKAGIQAGDLITEIRRSVDPKGAPLSADAQKVYSTKGMKTEQALDIILGVPGSPISVTVERERADGQKETIPFDLIRARVSVETVLGVKRVEANGKKDEWDFYIDPQSKIAYIHLTQFAPTSYPDLKAAIDRLKKTGLKGLVLDLRFNPGGLLRTAVFICDLFMDDGLIVEIRPRVGAPESYTGQSRDSETAFPMVVLVNNFSASASEIVAACLKDHDRAVVMGERSYGKGSVQQVEDFVQTGGQIKLTTARYFPPKGENIDKLNSGGKDEDTWGVKPNTGFELKLSREEKTDLAERLRNLEIIPRRNGPPKEEKEFKDRQLEKAVEYLRAQIKPGSAVGARK